jgi:hypothetical protein
VGIRVVLEVAPKRTFASALDWPGWSRGGTTEDEALEALLHCAPRYAAVAKRASASFAPPATRTDMEVVDRMRGSGVTEFGAPGKSSALEDEPVSPATLKRLLTLLRASWSTFDAAAEHAADAKLAKGPRGGGRDLDTIIAHVRQAEVAYLGKLGSRAPASANESAEEPMALLRSTFADALVSVVAGTPPADPSRTRKLWSPRYSVRRAAWHVLDHAWEIEDRTP